VVPLFLFACCVIIVHKAGFYKPFTIVKSSDRDIDKSEKHMITQIVEHDRYATEHPHVERVSSAQGRRPVIRETHVPVGHIAQLYKAGARVDEIVQTYPHLKPSAVYDAISYYLDHQTEIDEEIDEDAIVTPALSAFSHKLTQALTQDGLLAAIRPPIADLQPYQNRTPVTAQGKPLSEVIIEDRR
jgi:uncharacterized protein (DUF433 family)